MPTRCAVYARYSSDQQRPESIADQVRHCRQEAARHPDWVVLDTHVYADEALTGSSVEGRNGLHEVVQAALTIPKPFDLIVVDDTSRLARDVVDTVRQFRELRFHGVDLYFVNQGLHSGRDNAEFLLSIYGAMDSEQIRELGRKTHRGLEGQARNGFSAGGSALGYQREAVYDHAGRVDRDGQPRRLGVEWRVDPAGAEIVRRIFRWYADGHGLGWVAARLNAEAVPTPREAKGHQTRRDSAGPGWDPSTVRGILANELYRGRLIWNRSQWVRVPGSRRRRQVPRPESEWVIVERPDLRIIDEALWEEVRARRVQVRAHYDRPAQFGKTRAAYGTYLLSGRLTCGLCGGGLTIRTGRPQRYGCTRHWRRGATGCPNNLLVRRDLAEGAIVALLQAKLYTSEGVEELVQAVNTRLANQKPVWVQERTQLQARLADVQRRLDGLRHFVERGDTSPKVRQWLQELEPEERRLDDALAALSRRSGQTPLRVLPGRVERYLQDLRSTLARDAGRARQLLHADLTKVIIHPVRPNAAKPFARAEVVTTGKGLLDRVAFVVAGAGFEPATFGL